MNNWTSRIRSVIGLGVAVAFATALLASTAAAAGYEVQSVTSWKQNAAPMGWSASLNRVMYNSRGADGMFDAYSANPDASAAQCVTCALPSFPEVGAATQRGVSDVSPDGNYMLLEVERADHVGQVGDTIAEPGKGAYNDVWLATTDGYAGVAAHGHQRTGPAGDRNDVGPVRPNRAPPRVGGDVLRRRSSTSATGGSRWRTSSGPTASRASRT